MATNNGKAKAVKTGISVAPRKVSESQKRLNGFTETLRVVRFPALLPFAVTVLRVRGSQWTIRCGGYVMDGSGGEDHEIAAKFVEYVHQEVQSIKWEVEKEVENINDPIPL